MKENDIQEIVACYWQIGRLIVEEEQQGETRGVYGKGLIKERKTIEMEKRLSEGDPRP